MSTYHFIQLHLQVEGDDPLLLDLKKEFNTLATHYNTLWPKLSPPDRDEMINKLAMMEWEILDYMYKNKPSSNQ